MSLRDYARKRSFDSTPEPSAEGRARRTRNSGPIFVVQLHHASSRHYDFRLEADGALKSWAVPKGPSLRAGEKRLAVEVEDHPLDYATFEGEIPAGQYGAGKVEIFDGGTWVPEGDPLESIAAGKLDFTLQGDRLRGRFTLVRTRGKGRQPQWLLIKRSDQHARDTDADALLEEPAKPRIRETARKPVAKARKAATAAKKQAARTGTGKDDWQSLALAAGGRAAKRMPRGIEPQLATLHTRPPQGEGWLHEVKWDGYRLLAYRDGDGDVELCSRNQLPWSGRLPHLVQALEELPVADAVIDGELIAIDARGRSDFGLLQALLERGDTGGLRFVAFDLLHLDGVDLREAGLLERRALLGRLIEAAEAPALAFSEHVEGDAAAAFQASAGSGLEGIVCKRADAPYRSGRSRAWVKLKHVADESFVVVGYTPPKNSRHGFGSLLLAQPGDDGLEYVGRVGSGFSDDSLRTIHRRLRALQAREAIVDLPDHIPFPRRSVHWVQPQLMVDVHTRGRGKEGLVRQASFVRLREDLPSPAAGRRRARPSQEKDMASSRLTSPDREVFPGEGITKQDVADYYAAVADWLLPELVERPLSLLRCPDGAGGECFFQKHHADSLGPGVHPVTLRERDGKDDYIYVRDIEGVLSLVQMNAIEFHPWGARRKAPEKPDRLVFDLDPADGVPWDEVKRAAREVRDRLAEVGLQSWPRLSGGKGIHVCVPVRPGPDWEAAKHFCEAFAKAMTAHSPMRYVATASKQARRGRIFIDWLRNGRGATSVASWVLRARPGAPVAMPLRWEELGRTRSGGDYNLAKAKRRAASLRGDPWEGFAESTQRLPSV